jgi:sigma-54 dependent transcriptional regulator, acetoin dehydrogenase operon transcriptional activator AcoR
MAQIAQARSHVLESRAPHNVQHASIASWITQSWLRCISRGQRFGQRVAFDMISTAQMRRTSEANRVLVQAARPVLAQMQQAMAQTQYFAILANSQGVVVDSHGPIDARDRRASLITRVGVDLSEQVVGTTAISAALHEQQPIWMHRGEHFHTDTSVYSCAGAPIFGPSGDCVGMLDLTGIERQERPELQHLVRMGSQSIEHALLLALPSDVFLRINWPGFAMGSDADGLLALDADGLVLGMNSAARQILGSVNRSSTSHASDFFAMPYGQLINTRGQSSSKPVPLWSGLQVQLLAEHKGTRPAHSRLSASPMLPPAGPDNLPLRTMQSCLIRDTVAQHKGNVAAAAKQLGISRATVYRKLRFQST